MHTTHRLNILRTGDKYKLKIIFIFRSIIFINLFFYTLISL